VEGGWLLTRRPKAMIELLNLAHPQIRYFHRYFREVVDNSWGLSACKMKCPVCYGVLPKEVWTKVSMKESVCVGADRRLWEKVISQINKQTNRPAPPTIVCGQEDCSAVRVIQQALQACLEVLLLLWRGGRCLHQTRPARGEEKVSCCPRAPSSIFFFFFFCVCLRIPPPFGCNAGWWRRSWSW